MSATGFISYEIGMPIMSIDVKWIELSQVVGDWEQFLEADLFVI
jgi:hypothetical protein